MRQVLLAIVIVLLTVVQSQAMERMTPYQLVIQDCGPNGQTWVSCDKGEGQVFINFADKVWLLCNLPIPFEGVTAGWEKLQCDMAGLIRIEHPDTHQQRWNYYESVLTGAPVIADTDMMGRGKTVDGRCVHLRPEWECY